jgi:hypothetical protein
MTRLKKPKTEKTASVSDEQLRRLHAPRQWYNDAQSDDPAIQEAVLVRGTVEEIKEVEDKLRQNVIHLNQYENVLRGSLAQKKKP